MGLDGNTGSSEAPGVRRPQRAILKPHSTYLSAGVGAIWKRKLEGELQFIPGVSDASTHTFLCLFVLFEELP